MSGFTKLLDLVGGRWPMEDEGPSRRLQIALQASLAAVGFAGVYGLAAGSTDLALALGNLWKVPMVVVLSSLCALPAGLLAWKLSGAEHGASRLVVGVAAGNFAATLVLAALSPLIALYYHTSTFWGAPVAMGTVALAVSVGLFSAGRLALRGRGPGPAEGLRVTVPFGVMMLVQLVALLQFVHVASPILPEVTVFDRGVDGVFER